jgi:hypothetical protein
MTKYHFLTIFFLLATFIPLIFTAGGLKIDTLVDGDGKSFPKRG